jgi:hypothetical protein
LSVFDEFRVDRGDRLLSADLARQSKKANVMMVFH